MSILIKGMEMPKNCNECPLHFYEGQRICSCRALPAIDDDEILKPWKNKRKDCPLVPVPEHGRLIDADAYMCRHAGGEMLKFAPTVIVAEEGE